MDVRRAIHRLDLLQLQLQLMQQMMDNHQAMLHLLFEENDGPDRRGRRRRRWWTRDWLLRRPALGSYDTLVRELRLEDPRAFKNLLRVEPDLFREILQRIEPRISRNDTWWRRATQPGLKLAITLRHLATGDSYHSLMYFFRVPHNSISLHIKEVCEAIIDAYVGEVMETPTTPNGWRQVAQDFWDRWQFPHCCGALDGKHIAIKCPPNSGSIFYNYKGFYSIILLALVDADYRFLWVNVGANGSSGDAQIFNNSDLRDSIITGGIGFPPPEPLPRDDQPTPYFIVGDDAFGLRTWLMKPHSKRNLTDPERIFNYRLSRARRIVENAFGILSQRFGCLLTTLRQDPETVNSIVMACVVLHNLMRIRYPRQLPDVDQEGPDHQVIPGAWRQNNELIDAIADIRGGNRDTRAAKAQRQYLTAYFNTVGAVPWQANMI